MRSDVLFQIARLAAMEHIAGCTCAQLRQQHSTVQVPATLHRECMSLAKTRKSLSPACSFTSEEYFGPAQCRDLQNQTTMKRPVVQIESVHWHRGGGGAGVQAADRPTPEAGQQDGRGGGLGGGFASIHKGRQCARWELHVICKLKEFLS